MRSAPFGAFWTGAMGGSGGSDAGASDDCVGVGGMAIVVIGREFGNCTAAGLDPSGGRLGGGGAICCWPGATAAAVNKAATPSRFAYRMADPP